MAQILALITSFFFSLMPAFHPAAHSVVLISTPKTGFFHNLLRPLSTPTPDPAVTMGLTGDLSLGRVIFTTARTKNDFSWSFQKIDPWLKTNDFNLANLESPIVKDCTPGSLETFTFCGDTRFLPYLRSEKFIFNLANNHIFNYGLSGFSQTQLYLSRYQIPFVYSHNSGTEFIVKEVSGIKFGFLGYDFITNPQLDRQQILNTIKKYKPQVNWLIVSLHWGNEYRTQPESWRIAYAHSMIDAGADIIHGHHPHVWQSPEIYKNRPIFYSFGNFIFDQNWSAATTHSQVVRLTLTKNEIKSINYFPITIRDNSQPVIDSGY